MMLVCITVAVLRCFYSSLLWLSHYRNWQHWRNHVTYTSSNRYFRYTHYNIFGYGGIELGGESTATDFNDTSLYALLIDVIYSIHL